MTKYLLSSLLICVGLFFVSPCSVKATSLYRQEEPPKVEEAVIILKTDKAIGEKVSLMAQSATRKVTIEGVKERVFSGIYQDLTLTSQTLVIRGRITTLGCWGNSLTSIELKNCNDLKVLGCSSNFLTDLNLAECPQLRILSCHTNAIAGSSMTDLIKSLPDRSKLDFGRLDVHKSPDQLINDDNRCLKSDIALAKTKNWKVAFGATGQEIPGDEEAPASIEEISNHLVISIYPTEGNGKKVSIEGAKAYQDLILFDALGHILDVSKTDGEGKAIARLHTCRGGVYYIKVGATTASFLLVE